MGRVSRSSVDWISVEGSRKVITIDHQLDLVGAASVERGEYWKCVQDGTGGGEKQIDPVS